MIEIFRRKSLCTIREIYFSNAKEQRTSSSDIDFYVQSVCPISSTSVSFNTLVSDLTRSPDELFSAFSKNHRYDIRRAVDKDHIRCAAHFRPSQSTLERFIFFYNNFAHFRGLAQANKNKLRAFLSADNLIISEAKEQTENSTYAMHCYVSDGHRARLYYSATLPRRIDKNDKAIDFQLIGRANKLLHWESMLALKYNGMREYDFGGISNNEKLKGIDDFKRQFGGLGRTEYNTMVPVSTLGKLVLSFRRLVGR